ncbi:molybdopterin cofactor-binding domain-containing protein [Pelagicoccus sp. SDUM812003]|uniref:xanthine dehydrogenase family protein molybdopterin-binding subunit n=1 Tax=Pelagicoccus sp. SDUM812003 TaxID=3041267 RepID=UPI00280EE24C|nr:molybdopterin cofactor-binding domain-containing protein [Pelagicoccus sp. SDUM812003]MDQ8204372.1 molybdopterin-dependent oxidoreductase [Pelagicoccus sp. SDUM812003]
MSQSTLPRPTFDRRDFIKASALAGGGLLLSALIPSRAFSKTDLPSSFEPNFFIRIDSKGAITIISKNPEIGQGIKTSLPMIVAEELEAPWESVTVEAAPYVPGLFGWQGAGGSGATPGHYHYFRQVGAVGRAMLENAAAQTWGVSSDECQADQGVVKHLKSKKTLAYKDLVATAATMEAPALEEVSLKDPKTFKLLGKRITGVDNRKLVTGEPLFGIDQQAEGMRHACYLKCPAFGGSPRSANLETIKRMKGVVDAYLVTDQAGIAPGIAIVASDSWSAQKAMESLQVLWNEGSVSEQNSLLYDQNAQERFASEGPVIREDGDVEAVFSQAPTVVEAQYKYPYLSHATLEPQNTTALYQDGKLTIWSPTQNPGSAVDQVASSLEIPKENIHLEITRIGGGFGRRLMSDFVAEAAYIAKRNEGVPIKLTWTREQDMQQDYYRAAGWHSLKGAVDSDGKLAAWKNHFVTLGHNSTEQSGHGAGISSDELPARFVEHYLQQQSILSSNVPMGWWRAPGSCALAFVIQSFMDELAVAAKVDPLAFRLNLLGPDRKVPADNPRSPDYDTARMKGVLRQAAEKAGWGKSLAKGRGQGIAFHFSHQGYVAVVADVSVSQNGSLKVEKLTAAVDVGPIVNLSGAENQVHGSMLDALNSAWRQEITVENGRVRQGNFDTYPMLRISDAPKLDAVFIQSDNPPTGLGEPAFPPTTPAITNAIYAACGKRVRSLPLIKNDLSWS